MIEEFYACFDILEAVASRHQPMQMDEVINLAYLCFFYGSVGDKSKAILRNRLAKKYDESIIKDIFDSFESGQPKYKNKLKSYLPFNGHQMRLGHYYRHLYQCVKFINSQKILNYDKKYSYVKTLRAQLSTQEQVLFFFNSLSDLGSAWERGEKIINPNDKLVTKYNFIRNIPIGFVKKVDVRKYYPLIEYEGEEESKEKKKLKKMYY